MATIKTFEEIEAWQRARSLSRLIHEITIEGSFAMDYTLRNQINGSAGSVMDNIAEGFEREGSREFIQFLSIAKGSVGELRSQLYRSLHRRYINNKFEQLKGEALTISKLLSGLIRYLKGSDIKGTKFSRTPQT